MMNIIKIYYDPASLALAVGGLSALSTGASVGMSAMANKKATKEINNATNDVKIQNDVAIKKLQDSQEQSSVKETDNVKRRMARFTQTNYSSPLGISGQANVARKTLLGQ